MDVVVGGFSTNYCYHEDHSNLTQFISAFSKCLSTQNEKYKRGNSNKTCEFKCKYYKIADGAVCQ